MSVDNLLREIAASGFLLNNLFQLTDGAWRANLRKRGIARTPGALGDWQHEYCDGETPEEALAGAVSKLGGFLPPFSRLSPGFLPALVRNRLAREELTSVMERADVR